MLEKYYFLILTLISILFSTISNELLNSDALLINSLAEQFSYKQIEEALLFQKRWEWVSFVILPLILLIKISIISAILDAGCFFFGKEIKYKKLFNIVVKAEFVFLLVIVFKTAWFYFFQTSYTLEDLQYFYPLSALNIIGYKGLQPWFIYPFQVLNLFELAYWFILAYLIGKELNENTDKGLSIVASSYGVGLLIWVVGVMFFTLNMS
ncbi:hypothetical protein FHS04_000837 [Mesoflavibacter sabulilitoris]|uniref:Yip1 domain-containing protein n=1 Tax=Mesoflavibacter zeaxanthinifaciens subsp. sabulilitoris TaxID=1520893 RepID=A0A2T1N609_9FLAO|nr:hypothetical protein [Mesoflavibacter zeaxanthinifaciens]MBB3123340.1 hypothetical protein [Mesoflavibacter zeaxanthinifaciens subsp. sabulilitoris]PSG87026.1 hypothetical protein C7H61_13020 [Mesoflavibacter zeaxanthinifaciens subsp. sabulilitoris]